MRVAEWEESKYLVLSSFVFFIPCVYAYTQQLYVHSAFTALCTVASINFWRDAEYGYRRNLDVACARVGLAWGLYECTKTSIPIPYLSEIALSIGGSYALSKLHYRRNQPQWLYYHIAFHIITSIHCVCGLYVIKRYK